ncbi:legumain-like [Neoarius graeffei]|uniref:legumain-like n=1 Tax=Neoarius graeffei TaxID=443677 RepID=UPI00298D3ED5|nr:legumain-like [Neoarius graeffei]
MEVQDVVANKDVAVVILEKKIQNAKNPEEKERFEKEKFELLQGRELVIKSMKQIVAKCTDSPEVAERVLNGKSQAYSRPEYKEVAEYYKGKCFNWHESKYQSAMHHLYLFANLIEEKVTVERIKNAIDEVGGAMRAEKELEKSEEKMEDCHTKSE